MNLSRFSFLGTTPVLAPNVWADENPKVDTRSRESNSGPQDCEADGLPHDHGQYTKPGLSSNTDKIDLDYTCWSFDKKKWSLFHQFVVNMGKYLPKKGKVVDGLYSPIRSLFSKMKAVGKWFVKDGVKLPTCVQFHLPNFICQSYNGLLSRNITTRMIQHL